MSTATDSPIRVLRESKGLSRDALARITGLTSQTVYRLETGRTAGSDQTLALIADALEVPPEVLVPSHAPERTTCSTGRGLATNAKGRPDSPDNGGTAPTSGA